VYLFLSRGRRTGDKYAGQKTVIDLADLEECLSHHWYAVQSEGTFRAYFPTGGSLPSFLTGIPMTCHLDGDKLNNRRNNLSLFGKPFNSFVVKGNLAYLLLKGGKKTVIDLADLEKALNQHWSARRGENGTFYATGKSFVAAGGKTIQLHVLISGFKKTGHIDFDGLNNTRTNLRDGGGGVNERHHRKSVKAASG
jgi:hypothetical protein